MMKMCFNWKVLAGLAAVAVGIFLFAPNLIAGALPLLLLAACPLSMLIMMFTMRHGGHDRDAAEELRSTASEHNDPRDRQLRELQAQHDALAEELASLKAAGGLQTREDAAVAAGQNGRQ